MSESRDPATDFALIAAQGAAKALSDVGAAPRQVLVIASVGEVGQESDGTALVPLGVTEIDAGDEHVAETLYTHFVMACKRMGVDVSVIAARYGQG